MKWIDYTALTLAIIGAFSRLIYDLVGLSGLYLLTLFGRIGRDM